MKLVIGITGSTGVIYGIRLLEILKEKGIEVVHALDGVGKNLQDHLETYIQQECKRSETLYSYINKFCAIHNNN